MEKLKIAEQARKAKESQRRATDLMFFYQSTTYEIEKATNFWEYLCIPKKKRTSWDVDDSWCSEKPLEEWYGLSLDEEGLVDEINLPDNNLRKLQSIIISLLVILQVKKHDHYLSTIFKMVSTIFKILPR